MSFITVFLRFNHFVKNISTKNNTGTRGTGFLCSPILPSTGGIGTTIFYVAGLIMVLGAATILIARRKADAE